MLIIAGEGFAGVVRVKFDATGTGDGSSWENAFPHLQDALAATSEGDEIWVAAGTYYPDRGAEQTPGDRLVWFTPKNGMSLYGGFAGNETLREQRDVGANESILSGKIAAEKENWSLHVISMNGVDDAMLDGFTITGGNATGTKNGGGAHINSSSVTLRNCHFAENFGQFGGAIRSWESSLIVTNTTFTGNTGRRDGGAISAVYNSLVIRNSTFTSNEAERDGGAVSAVGNDSLIIRSSTFTSNGAQRNGGAVFSEEGTGSSQMVTDSVFSGNFAGVGGGAVLKLSPYEGVDVPMVIERCTFTGNKSEMRGGAVRSYHSDVTINDSTFTGNLADFGGAIRSWESSLIVTNTTFTGNTGRRDGGAISAGLHSLVIIRNSTFTSNEAERDGGAVSAVALRSLTIQNSTFTSNGAERNGGAVFSEGGTGSSQMVTDSVFSGNFAGVGGGAVLKLPQSGGVNVPMVIERCTFTGNKSEMRGGAVRSYHSDVTINDSTFTGNLANLGGAISNFSGAETQVNRSVFWGNSGPAIESNLAHSEEHGGSPRPSFLDIRNSLFLDNDTAIWTAGGGTFPNLIIENCTFTGDVIRADASLWSAGIEVSNAIFWSSAETSVSSPIQRPMNPETPFSRVTYNLIEGGYPGEGNISSDPLFVDLQNPAGPDEAFGTADDGLRLRARSPAIDAGNNDFVEEGETDLAGNPRIQWERVDLGAFESAPIAPDFVSEPDSTTLEQGETAVLEADVVGAMPVSYQWEVNGEAITDDTKFSGSMSPTLTISDTQLEDEGAYRLIASNDIGSTSSQAAELTVIELEELKIHTPPQDMTAYLGDTVTFSVAAGGERPLDYQWFHRGKTVSGANERELTVEDVGPDEAGNYAVLVSNVHGSALSPAAALTVIEFKREPPEFTLHPEATTVFKGERVTLTVEATGAPPIEYQWLKDGEEISNSDRFLGTDSAELVIENAQAEDEGSYAVVASNDFGSTTSEPAELTIREVLAPVIVAQPEGAAVHPGESVTFSVEVVGVEPLSYQWHHDGRPVEGATAPELTIEASTAADSGQYVVVARNEHGSALSTTASLTVHPAPALPYDSWISEFDLPAEEREEDANPAGDGLPNLLKYAMGLDPTEPASFSFQRHLGVRLPYSREVANIELSTELSDDMISWESTPLGKYPFKEIALHEDGSYRILVWIEESFEEAPKRFIRIGVDRPAAMTTSATLAPLAQGEPAIHTQPESATAYLGDTIVFSVGVEGEEPLNYQWYHEGQRLSGETANELEIESVKSSDAGRYAVLVTNPQGSVLSSEAVLTVREFEREPPEFAVQPESLSALQGQEVVLSAEVVGAPPVTYQWLKDGDALEESVRLSGTASASLIIENAQPEDSGTYTLVATNDFGGTTSDPAELTVEEVLSPRITAQPRNTATHLGETATLSLTALGVEPLSYQWFRNGAPIEGATDPTLTLEGLSLAEAGSYRAVVTNEHGSAVSEAAHLTVHPVEALPYETWIANFSLLPQQREEAATPAGDGTPNLLKYVIGGDPTQPVGSVMEHRLVLSFEYAADIVDVRFSLEVSEDGLIPESIPLDSYPHKRLVALEDGYYRAYVWFDESFEATLRKSIRLRAGR